MDDGTGDRGDVDVPRALIICVYPNAIAVSNTVAVRGGPHIERRNRSSKIIYGDIADTVGKGADAVAGSGGDIFEGVNNDISLYCRLKKRQGVCCPPK